ncbi:ATP-grasp domain-containing protein [Clostridium saccharoperbutylacetonicum]|uniref:ATP-grasp domain-containing protein n=1 Tax=Clostridium saccharoperbutylacetonicum TaxID=36745 RepID=UPI0039E839FE
MKTILIVNMANSSRKIHFEAARCHGAKLILLMKDPTWEREYVDKVVNIDTGNLKEVVEKVLELQKEEKVDGVIPFTEHSVPAAAAAATVLGVPFISNETANIARNKHLMRKAFVKAGIPCPMFEIANDLLEAKKISANFKYPIVLKPLIGGGSLAVRRINNENELEQYFDEIKNAALTKFEYDPLYEQTNKIYNGAILIESYIPGGEVSVEGITVNGETTVLGIHDKRLPMEGPYFGEVYFTTPSILPQSVQEKLIYWTKKANEALNINMGATHTEFRITDDENVVILETGARIGGGGTYKSILASTGIDMVHSIMDISLGKVPDLTYEESRPVARYNFFAEKEGIIKNISGVEEVRADPSVIELLMYKKIGDKVSLPPNSIPHGHVIIRPKDLKNVDEHMKKIISKIIIDVC